jgi:hypothetical protein
VRELTQVLGKEGLLREPARELPLPTELRRLVGYRLHRLSAGCYQLLGVCAAIGDDVDLGLLAELVPGPNEPLLAEAVGAGVLTEDAAVPDRLRFSHAVVRQARYDELPRTERVALHRSIAEALARKGFGDEYAGDLARHRVRAAVDEPGRRLAAQACRAAAQAATRRGAVDEARAWYERTLALDCDIGATAATAARPKRWSRSAAARPAAAEAPRGAGRGTAGSVRSSTNVHSGHCTHPHSSVDVDSLLLPGCRGRGLLDEVGNSLRLRYVDGVAGPGLGNRGAFPIPGSRCAYGV